MSWALHDIFHLLPRLVSLLYEAIGCSLHFPDTGQKSPCKQSGFFYTNNCTSQRIICSCRCFVVLGLTIRLCAACGRNRRSKNYPFRVQWRDDHVRHFCFALVTAPSVRFRTNGGGAGPSQSSEGTGSNVEDVRRHFEAHRYAHLKRIFTQSYI